jgi:predicted phosphoribosyltransferase
VKNRGAASITVAIPVGPPSTISELEKMANRVLCLYTPEFFQAIGEFYKDFSQTSDEEVIGLLLENKRYINRKSESKVIA